MSRESKFWDEVREAEAREEWRGIVRPVSEYEPFDQIRRGDVIRWNGRLRTVRRVLRSPCDDAVRIITFAKLRCSGYQSPSTTYWRSDIRRAFGGIVAHRHDAETLCTTPTECRVQREIDRVGPATLPPYITETESVGVVW